MSLADRAKTGPPPNTGPGTKLDSFLRTLPKGEREAFETMMRDPRWQHRALHAALKDEGHEPPFSVSRLGEYRREKYGFQS